MFVVNECFPANVKINAEHYFREDKFNCAEAVLKSVLIESGMLCPIQFIRMATAFGRGMGGSGCCCGALVGGQMAIGALFGRTKESGFPPEECGRLAKKLYDIFVERNKATCCRVLHKGLPFGSPEQLEACAKRTAETAEITALIVSEAVSCYGVALPHNMSI